MSYQIRIQQFEGPLDLLLHLIEKAEVDIKDIFISEITTQYLTYMAELDALDMDTASEFLSVAATLVFIKSRSLLPRPTPALESEEDPEQALIRQIREYKVFKEAGEKLQTLAESASGTYWRLPFEYPLPPPMVNVSGVTLGELYQAFISIVLMEKQREEENRPKEVERDEYTIADKILYIQKKLSKGKIRFFELFKSGSRLEMIVTFMALLELISSGIISAVQEESFGEIIIGRRTDD